MAQHPINQGIQQGIAIGNGIAARRNANTANQNAATARRNLQMFEKAEDVVWDLAEWFKVLPSGSVAFENRVNHLYTLKSAIQKQHNVDMEEARTYARQVTREWASMLLIADIGLAEHKLNAAMENQLILEEALKNAGIPIPELKNPLTLTHKDFNQNDYKDEYLKHTQSELNSHELAVENAKEAVATAQNTLDTINNELLEAEAPFKNRISEINPELFESRKAAQETQPFTEGKMEKRFGLFKKYHYCGLKFKTPEDVEAFKQEKIEQLAKYSQVVLDLEAKIEATKSEMNEASATLLEEQSNAKTLLERAQSSLKKAEQNVKDYSMQLEFAKVHQS